MRFTADLAVHAAQRGPRERGVIKGLQDSGDREHGHAKGPVRCYRFERQRNHEVGNFASETAPALLHNDRVQQSTIIWEVIAVAKTLMLCHSRLESHAAGRFEFLKKLQQQARRNPIRLEHYRSQYDSALTPELDFKKIKRRNGRRRRLFPER